MRRQVKLAARIGLLLLSTCVGLLLGEVVFRIIGSVKGIDFRLFMKELKRPDRLPSGMFVGDTQTLRPGSQVLAVTSDFSVIYTINSRGLRDREHSLEKPSGVLRALICGDSFVFGEGVSYGQRFSEIPEARFKNLELINFGVPGYGLADELAHYAREGAQYKPDLVIAAVSNVIADRYNPSIIQNGAVILDRQTTAPPLDTPSTSYLRRDDPLFREEGRSLLDRSYLLSYLRYRIALWRLRQRWRGEDKELWERIVRKARRRKEQHGPDHARLVEERTLLLLRKFHELTRAQGSILILLGIDRRRELPFAGRLPLEPRYYSLTDALAAEDKKRPLSFTYDPHFNPRTHRFIGERLNEILRDVVEKYPRLPRLRE